MRQAWRSIVPNDLPSIDGTRQAGMGRVVQDLRCLLAGVALPANEIARQEEVSVFSLNSERAQDLCNRARPDASEVILAELTIPAVRRCAQMMGDRRAQQIQHHQSLET